MPFLPEEIMEDNILMRLPVKSISRFRCVSKSWLRLFRNPNFIRKHLNHAILMNNFNILVANIDHTEESSEEPYVCCVDKNVLSSTSSPFLVDALPMDYPLMCPGFPPEILGSSNGLVCIDSSFGCSLCIWNPATREYKPLPRPKSFDLSTEGSYGFYFDSKNDDYKLLRICKEGEGSEAIVYSLASDSWKELDRIPYRICFPEVPGLLHNGVLYWIAKPEDTQSYHWVILCFNISDETFHQVPLPFENTWNLGLVIWQEKLCLLHNDDHIDVWIMMDNKWSKHLKINAQMTDMPIGILRNGKPIQTLQNGQVLFEGAPIEENGFYLLLYDTNLEKAKALKIRGFPQQSSVETYIETLVPLNSGTYVATRKNKNNNKKKKCKKIMTDVDLMNQTSTADVDLMNQ